MRSEKEMYELISSFAERNDRIRAVYMNGSRANPSAPKDIFMDYDIVYVVDDVSVFLKDRSWLSYFGQLVVMQEPDLSALFDDKRDIRHCYAFLMQFADGNRIDLTLRSLTDALTHYGTDSETVLLLDKDALFRALPPASDVDYRVKRPTAEEFRSCCNEFWWVAPYAAKGLWRGEPTYAMDQINLYIRPMLLLALGWYAGCLTNFTVSVGKNSKYLRRYIPAELWDMLLCTYPEAKPESMWTALFTMTGLFSSIAPRLASALGYEYDPGEGERTTDFIRDVRLLPPDAQDIIRSAQ